MAKMSSGRLSMVLPVPPRLNSKYRYTRTGRVFVDPKHVKYGNDLVYICKQQGADVLVGDLAVDISFYEEKKRPQHQSDIDSILKTLLDSLNGIAYTDDRQIIDLHVHLIRNAEKSLIEIEIHELE